MAMDIMQSLVGLLCPTYSAQSACQQFINQPAHQAIQPLGPLIYFLFFPTVFLILLIYIGTGVVLRGNVASVKGLRLLLAVAVLVAIVIQGYYPLILVISDIWFLLLPLIFIIFFIIRHRGGGGGGGGMSGAGGGGLVKAIMRKASGVEKARADEIRARIQRLENTAPGTHGVDQMVGEIADELRTFLKESIHIGTFSTSEYDKLFSAYKKACASAGTNIPNDVTKPKDARKMK